MVVMDAAGEYSMYASDVTRTLPVNGHFTDRQREIYNIVLGAQRAAAEAFVSGKSTLYNREHPEDSLDGVARDYIKTHGKDLHGQPLDKYFIHGLSHSVGIDVHDPLGLHEAHWTWLCLHDRARNLHPRGEDRRPHRRHFLCRSRTANCRTSSQICRTRRRISKR